MSLLPEQNVCAEFPLRQGELSSALCALLLFVLAALSSFAVVCSCRALFVFSCCNGTLGAGTSSDGAASSSEAVSDSGSPRGTRDAVSGAFASFRLGVFFHALSQCGLIDAMLCVSRRRFQARWPARGAHR